MLVVQARAHQPDVNLPVIDLILVTINSEPSPKATFRPIR